jgi:hypothetical protein
MKKTGGGVDSWSPAVQIGSERDSGVVQCSWPCRIGRRGMNGSGGCRACAKEEIVGERYSHRQLPLTWTATSVNDGDRQRQSEQRGKWVK